MTARVLVVNDDPALCALLAEAVVRRGLDVATAQDLTSATRLVRTFKPDFIALDLAVSDGNGAGWLAALRAQGWPGRVAVISGTLDDPLVLALLPKHHVDRVFHKPVAASDVATYAHELLREPSVGRGNPLPAAPALDAVFQALRDEYVASLPAQLDEIDSSLDGVAGTGIERLRSVAHRLAGTAGSYGLSTVGVAAGSLERLTASVPPGSAEEIQTAVAELGAVVARVLASGATLEGEPSCTRGRVLVIGTDHEQTRTWQAAGKRMLVDVEVIESLPSPPVLSAYALDGAVLLDPPPSNSIVDALVAAGLQVSQVSRESSVATRIRAARAGIAAFVLAPADLLAAEQVLAQLVSRPSASPRVLIVDDDPGFVTLLEAVLRRAAMEVASITNGDELFDTLERFRPDALVLDEDLGNLRGSDLCRAIRTCARWHALPVLVLTRMLGQQVRGSVYACGADDYLEKPLDAAELVARLRARLRRAAELAERYDRDPLTGLLNRRVLTEQLGARLSTASRSARQLAVAMIDIDHFKFVNDRFGHAMGDTVLAALGRLIATRFRADDVRGRWGGEEFVLGFPGLRANDAARVIDDLRREFMAMSFEFDLGIAASATFSCGLAVYPDDGATVGRLIDEADRRLYLAKAGGRNRLVIAG